MFDWNILTNRTNKLQITLRFHTRLARWKWAATAASVGTTTACNQFFRPNMQMQRSNFPPTTPIIILLSQTIPVHHQSESSSCTSLCPSSSWGAREKSFHPPHRTLAVAVLCRALRRELAVWKTENNSPGKWNVKQPQHKFQIKWNNCEGWLIW